MIDHIHYNYLNLPDTVHMKGKGTICYSYDAGGNKLKKLTLDSTSLHATTTLYLGGFVYQQGDPIATPTAGVDTLQFMGDEEGRARWAFHKYLAGNTAYGWEYDFFEKDHLGNTRMILSQEKDTARYLASMEAAYRSTENALFYNIPATSYPRATASGYPVDLSVTNPNDSVIRVNGSGQKVGPAIILKVMSGDKVDIAANYFYNSSTAANGQSLSVSDVINTLANGIVSVTGGLHGSVPALTGGTSPLNASLSNFLSTQNPTTTGKPNAYLNWILLDDQFSYVSTGGQSGALQVGASGTASGGVLQPPLGQTGIQIKTSGYLYIYVSNATPGWDVFFDNLSVKTYSGPMLEENHYYPFGLTMNGISDKAIKTSYAQNKFRYNGKELQNQEFSDGTGLEEYDYSARFLDPQLGLWHNVDPHADHNRRWSPYNYGLDNPIRFVNPDGMDAMDQWSDIGRLGETTGEAERKSVQDQKDRSSSQQTIHDFDGKAYTVNSDDYKDNLELGGPGKGTKADDKAPKSKGSFASRTMKGALTLGLGIVVVGGGPKDVVADAGAGVVVVGGAVIAGVALAADAVYNGVNWLFSKSASEDGGRLAQDIISKDRKGSINKKFPDQYRNSTLDQIEKAAKAGADGAKKALKLLRDGRFKK